MFSLRDLATCSLLLAIASARPQWHPGQDWSPPANWHHRGEHPWARPESTTSSLSTAATMASRTPLSSSLAANGSTASAVTMVSASSTRQDATSMAEASSDEPCTRNTVTATAQETITVTSSSSSYLAAPISTDKHTHTSAGKHHSTRRHTATTPRSTNKPKPTHVLISKTSTSTTSHKKSTRSAVTTLSTRPSTTELPSTTIPSTTSATTTQVTSTDSPSATSQLTTMASMTTSEPTSTTEIISPTETTQSSAGTSKRGLITFPELIPDFAGNPKITWTMNWWHGSPDDKPDSWLFLPQLTHLEPDEWWPDATFRKDPASYPYIAGFLEPGVNDISVDDAVKSWKTNLEPLSAQHKLIPPMVGQNDLPWLQDFMNACTGCTFDGPIAFTLYVSGDDAGVADFKNHVEEFIAAFPDKDIWVANIGILADSDLSKSQWLMEQVVPYLDGLEEISHYAWNGGDGAFWDGSKLTPLAERYASL